jgi:hypothetical protein
MKDSRKRSVVKGPTLDACRYKDIEDLRVYILIVTKTWRQMGHATTTVNIHNSTVCVLGEK